MEGTYPVVYEEQTFGTVTVIREGLYLRITCRCRLPGKGIYKLTGKWQTGELNLGIPVPEGDSFVVRTRVAAKKIPAGEGKFLLVSNEPKPKGAYFPIYPEEPFAYIQRLKEGFLVRKNGENLIFFPEKQGTE